MSKVFRTPEDSASATEIVGVGVVGAAGKGGVAVEAAAASMPELQNDKGEPLTGKKLDEAARSFAETRGLRVVEVSENKLTTLNQDELGLAADRPPAAEVAEEEYRVAYEGLTPVNNDPEVVTEGGPEAGEPGPPPPASEAAQEGAEA